MSRTATTLLLLACWLPASVASAQEAVPAWPAKKDPKPLTTSSYLDVKVSYRQGKSRVLGVSKGVFPDGPKLITRFHGRHQLSLYSHGKLLDVVRFNFPLTAGSGEKTPAQEKLGEGLARGASAKITVRLPWDDRVTRILLTDGRGGKPLLLNLKGIVKKEPKLKAPNLRTVTFKPRKKKMKK